MLNCAGTDLSYRVNHCLDQWHIYFDYSENCLSYQKVQKKAAFLVEAILENRNEYEYSEEDNKLFNENPEYFFWTTSSEEERNYNYDMTDLPPLERLLIDYDEIMNAKI